MEFAPLYTFLVSYFIPKTFTTRNGSRNTYTQTYKRKNTVKRLRACSALSAVHFFR